MAFMAAYKRLDKLCKETNGIGVTGYIEDMEKNSAASFRVPGWSDDYKQLKHYRWVRNQISHEDNAEEENMCEPGDTEWLEDFRSRIMNQTDPLTLYRKANAPGVEKEKRKVYAGPTPSKSSVSYTRYDADKEMQQEYWDQYTSSKKSRRPILRTIAWLMLAAAVAFFVYALNHPELSWPWGNGVTFTIYGIYGVIMLILFFIHK